MPARQVVHDEDQVVVVVAVEDFDVDAGLGHPARELAELTGLGLVQPLHQGLPFGEHADAGRFERPARGGSVREQEVGDAGAVDDEGAAAPRR